MRFDDTGYSEIEARTDTAKEVARLGEFCALFQESDMFIRDREITSTVDGVD